MRLPEPSQDRLKLAFQAAHAHTQTIRQKKMSGGRCHWTALGKSRKWYLPVEEIAALDGCRTLMYTFEV